MSHPVDFREMPQMSDRFTCFAKDYLIELGMFIEDTPFGMGFDESDEVTAERQLNSFFCATEQVRSAFNTVPFRWLVHTAHRPTPRGFLRESDEELLLETLKSEPVNGFLGFYTDPPSTHLVDLLNTFQNDGIVKTFRFADSSIMENDLLSDGFRAIFSRYFPKSFAANFPTLGIDGVYHPLPCDNCGKDLLENMAETSQGGLLGWICQNGPEEVDPVVIHRLYFACPGECDEKMQAKYMRQSNILTTTYSTVRRLATPAAFIEHVLTLIDRLSATHYTYTEPAIVKEKRLIHALSQRVLREFTANESDDVVSEASFDSAIIFTPEE